jgi:flavorubredoxin
MWHSTQKMANAIGSQLAHNGLEAKVLSLKVNHRSDIMTDVLDAKALVLGSATLNNNMMPAMADFLTYFKGLRPRNKVVAAFGSYGWSGEAVKHLNQALEGINLPLAHPGLRIKNVPGDGDFLACRELADVVAKAVKDLK